MPKSVEKHDILFLEYGFFFWLRAIKVKEVKFLCRSSGREAARPPVQDSSTTNHIRTWFLWGLSFTCIHSFTLFLLRAVQASEKPKAKCYEAECCLTVIASLITTAWVSRGGVFPSQVQMMQVTVITGSHKVRAKSAEGKKTNLWKGLHAEIHHKRVVSDG